MTSFVLVPGACHGGWWYDQVCEQLNAGKHAAVAVTPAGLEDVPRLDETITLDTHTRQVADIVDRAAVSGPVVLVGHSYAGSIITGVADQVPERVRALVYLDAFIPEDGDSCWTMTNDEQRAWYIEGCRRTGYGVDPLPFFDDRARPHPIATLLQSSHLTGAWRRVPIKVHVTALGWPGASPMEGATARARSYRDFDTREWKTPHNVMADGPGRVVDLLSEF